MAKFFYFKSEPIVESLTIPEIEDGSEGWLITGPQTASWKYVDEGDSCSMSFPNVQRGMKTDNLQSCTCIIYTAKNPGENSYRGAWLYHGKGGYLSKGFPKPWELPGGSDLRPRDCLVAFNAWQDNSEWRGLIDRLDAWRIPSDNIVACLRPRKNFEQFAINGEGQIGEPFGPMSKRVSLEISEDEGLISGQSKASSRGFFSDCCCYITTAVSLALGLPDDNETLQMLRWYRDKILLKDPQGRADVETYYAVAPAIVQAIEGRSDSRDLYLWLYHRYLQPVVASIRAGRYATAHDTYREMVAELSPLAAESASLSISFVEAPTWQRSSASRPRPSLRT